MQQSELAAALVVQQKQKASKCCSKHKKVASMALTCPHAAT
jgi:hypothetical protein